MQSTQTDWPEKHQRDLLINEILQNKKRVKACACYFNSWTKLEGAGKDSTQEFLVGDLNRPTHLCVLLTEDVSETLEKNARLHECIKRQAPFPLWVITVQQALNEVWSQAIAHLWQHYNANILLNRRFTTTSSPSIIVYEFPLAFISSNVSALSYKVSIYCHS